MDAPLWLVPTGNNVEGGSRWLATAARVLRCRDATRVLWRRATDPRQAPTQGDVGALPVRSPLPRPQHNRGSPSSSPLLHGITRGFARARSQWDEHRGFRGNCGHNGPRTVRRICGHRGRRSQLVSRSGTSKRGDGKRRNRNAAGPPTTTASSLHPQSAQRRRQCPSPAARPGSEDRHGPAAAAHVARPLQVGAEHQTQMHAGRTSGVGRSHARGRAVRAIGRAKSDGYSRAPSAAASSATRRPGA